MLLISFTQIYIIYYVLHDLLCFILYFSVKYPDMTEKPTSEEIDVKLKEIGAKVRVHRKSVSGNYETFARDNGFNKVTISRLETGENFTMSSLIQVLRVLDISLEDLFRGIK